MPLEKKLAPKVPERLAPQSPEQEKAGSPESLIESKAPLEKSDWENDQSQPPVNPVKAQPKPALSYEEKRAQQIDKILEDGLNEIFLSLPVEDRQAFKKKGEETVSKINQLLSKTKVHLGKIVRLIRDWLKMVPGVNRFFLEQEAKIKASQIIKLKDKV